MISLKPLTKDDLELVLAWRSIPKVYRYQSTQTAPFDWDDHLLWFLSRENREDNLIIHEGRKVGIVNAINLHTDLPELGIYIGELTLHHKGIATKALKKYISQLRNRGYKQFCITVNKQNTNSIKLWEKLGFRLIGPVKDNTEWLYILK